MSSRFNLSHLQAIAIEQIHAIQVMALTEMALHKFLYYYCIHYTWSTNKIHLANQINRAAGNTLK